MTRSYLSGIMAIVLSLGLFACDSTEPLQGPGEEELITKVTLTLTAFERDPIIATASDPDGDGTGFVIDDIILEALTNYVGSIRFEDTVNNEDITSEVEEESDEHQIHYQSDIDLKLDVTSNDQDVNGLPIGLSFQFDTGEPSEGQLRVILSHYDSQVKDGTSLSDESDVDLSFKVTIQ